MSHANRFVDGLYNCDPDKLLPKPSSEFVCLELDEMWHFLGSKKKKLWIWKAYCRETKTLVTFECGDRDFAVLVRWVSKLKGCKVKFFFTDYFDPYQKLISCAYAPSIKE
jgi:IS1 family transposase